MWNRACPLCFAKVPRALVLSKSEDLVCPSCRAQLELSRPSRGLGAVAGLLAGYWAASWASGRGSYGAWALALLAAVLAFGAASAMAVFLFADLVVRPKEAGAFPHAAK